MCFKSPEMRACSAKASLHFIRDANASRRANVFVSVLEIILRELYKAPDALDGFRDEARDFSRRRVINDFFDIGCVFATSIRIFVTVRSAIGIGRDGVMHAEAVRHVVFPSAVRGESHAGGVAAMIRVAKRDHVEVPRVSPCHEQRDVVRF